MSNYSAGEHRLTLPGPAGQIEAVLTMPEAVTLLGAFAVVCHPHPLHGGAMENKVVATLVRLYRDHGLPALRFNFRGVGASAGHHDHAIGEVDDLAAVLRWGQASLGADTLLLAGFSFGSYIAAAGVARAQALGLRLEHLVLVAPPVHHYPFAALPLPAATVVVQGDADEVVPPAEVFAWVEGLSPPPRLIRFAACGHFFHGRLAELKAELAAASGLAAVTGQAARP
jgi:alpha/beta superfamily hydrolase